VIPHITDEIKRRIIKGAGDADVAMVEIGGTVGDIESQPFLEAIRQLRVEVGAKRAMLMHLTLVPYIATAGETKTKPTQHSVKELRSIGLQPDVLICRSDHEIDLSSRRKIALFTNVEERAVIGLEDVDTIYKIPPYCMPRAWMTSLSSSSACSASRPTSPSGIAWWMPSSTRRRKSPSPWSASTWSCWMPTSR